MREAAVDHRFWPIPAIGAKASRRAAIGHKQPFNEVSPNVRLPIRKTTFNPIAAAQSDYSVGKVSFEICKRKS